MDISGVSALAQNMNLSGGVDTVQLSVLKKALDINAQTGLQLVQAASSAAPSNPPHLGNKIDTLA